MPQLNKPATRTTEAMALVAALSVGCGDSGPAAGGGGASATGGSGGAAGMPEPIRGACCSVDTTCTESNPDDCDAEGGAFSEDQTCDVIVCPGPSVDAYRRLTRNLEATLSEDIEWYHEAVSIVAREYWNLNGDDPRYTNELLGRQGAAPGPDSPFTVRPFAASYKVVREADKFLLATQNAAFEVTPEQLSAATGLAKTFQAYALLLVANHQFSNGILPVEALSEADPSASFLGYEDSLEYIATLLDEAATLLSGGGAEFVFPLGLGFEGFQTPATFRQLNRALLARVRIYQGNKTGAISGIAGSFFNINGSMRTGPRHVYDGLDTRNPFYHERNVDLYTVHPMFLSDSEPGDLSISQKSLPYTPTPDFFVPIAFEGLVGDTQLSLVDEDYEPFPLMIRNEELILIYAEAQIGNDVNEVLAALNRSRNASNLGNYMGATSDGALLDAVLRRRRFSLYGEGHRWVDLRRTGGFSQIPVDRVGDVVHVEFPRPTNAVELAVSGL